MRVLFTIPHYFLPPNDSTAVDDSGSAASTSKASAANPQQRYGSTVGNRRLRVDALRRCLSCLCQHFSGINIEFDNSTGLIGAGLNQHTSDWTADIVVCTTKGRHVLDQIDLPINLVHQSVEIEPQHLGFACHLEMAARRDQYDFFCYLEDDILIQDPLYFEKQIWFRSEFGNECMLQPNRYELHGDRQKVYVDGPLPARFVGRYFDPQEHNSIKATCLSRTRHFVRSTNPMSACFALDQTQLAQWMASPIFDDRDDSFGSGLESAQILGPLQLFRIYKPALENAEFLEVIHADSRLTRLKTPKKLLDEL